LRLWDNGRHAAEPMNYLAHAFLSRESPDAITGALLGDFVKGRAAHDYAAPIRDAILLHRAIDRYTDAHPAVCAARARVSPAGRRFSGVLVDIFFDHFLARHFARFSTTPLAQFTPHVYHALDAAWPLLPPRLQRILPWMRADDWLASYAQLESVDAALHGIARRFRRRERVQPLAQGIAELVTHYDAFEAAFLTFFPELERFVQTERERVATTASPLAAAG
jgi:acyl carrier protein phosphodiesterase